MSRVRGTHSDSDWHSSCCVRNNSRPQWLKVAGASSLLVQIPLKAPTALQPVSPLCASALKPRYIHTLTAWWKRRAERGAVGSTQDAPSNISLVRASHTTMPNSRETGKHDPSVGTEAVENQMMMKWTSLSRVWLFATPWTNTVHGILQARILEWVAFPFSRGSSQPRDWTQISCIIGRFFIIWATREVEPNDDEVRTSAAGTTRTWLKSTCWGRCAGVFFVWGTTTPFRL